MRALLLIAGAALALGGCGNNDQKDNSLNVDENLTAENIVSNDVTAIDAVTGDAANMAADVDMNFGNLEENGVENGAAMPPGTARTAARKAPAGPAQSTANTAANAGTNGE